MKHTLRTIILAGCVAGLVGGAVIQTGCSSTPTRRSTGQTIDDASITARVKTDILRDSAIHDSDINVDTYRGEVQLNGWVNTQQMKQEAERVARNVNGVAAVQNNLQIKPEAAGAANKNQGGTRE